MTSVIRKKLSDLIPAKFHKSWKSCLDPKILNIVEKGGRGSGKSSVISIMMIQLLMRFSVNGLVVRKTDATLEQSVYEQLKWAIYEMNVQHLFKFNKSPLKITYIPRGNYILFRGAGEPEKLKSLKDARFPFALLWIEELAEFKTEEDVTVITNSILRGELDDNLFYKFFFSYNPPKRKQSWVNAKYNTSFIPQNTYINHSTYKDNPYISKSFREEAKTIEQKNPIKYRWEYLGEAIGSGVIPFDNLVIEPHSITDEMIENFDNIRLGIDFGYAADPVSFTASHYDKTRNVLYVFDEVYGIQISNRELANKIKSKGYQTYRIAADSAEPKSIAEIKREHNIPRIYGVKKGPDSVEYGEQWLNDLEAIYIDPTRTPNTAREFETIDYKTDRDGNVISRLEDKNNHSIDSVRYALNEDMRVKESKAETERKYKAWQMLGL